jgi:hypothetical protein
VRVCARTAHRPPVNRVRNNFNPVFNEPGMLNAHVMSSLRRIALPFRQLHSIGRRAEFRACGRQRRPLDTALRHRLGQPHLDNADHVVGQADDHRVPDPNGKQRTKCDRGRPGRFRVVHRR